MILLDVNVLVEAGHRDAIRHAASAAWLTAVLAGPRPVGVADVVLTGTVRVLTHRRVFADPRAAGGRAGLRRRRTPGTCRGGCDADGGDLAHLRGAAPIGRRAAWQPGSRRVARRPRPVPRRRHRNAGPRFRALSRTQGRRTSIAFDARLTRLNHALPEVDVVGVTSSTTLPPLDGSGLFDPWRRRYREQLGLPPEVEPVRQPTRSEVMLWEQLAGRAPGWVAEHPTVYGYSLDFYCKAVRLAVEVDGASHWGQRKAASDAWRDTVHERLGIRTKRFSAREVEQDLAWVVSEIAALVEERRAELASAIEVPDPAALADLVKDERLQLYPPDPPGWSASLPACRTVLPELDDRRSWLGLLRR